MPATDKFIQTLARGAGKILSGFFGKAQIVKTKTHPADVVTEADLAAEKFIVFAIKKNFPNHGIVAEESGNHFSGCDYVWYIDPLDGTFSFSRGNPIFCTMLGLTYKKRPLLSAIYDPSLKRLYFAKYGKGAFLNGTRIHCSAKKEWVYSYGVGPTNLRRQSTIDYMTRLLKQARKEPFWMGALGSVGISVGYAACGARDWFATGSVSAHEAPTSALLLKEAGCQVSNQIGKTWKLEDTAIVAANKYLHPQLLKLVRGK